MSSMAANLDHAPRSSGLVIGRDEEHRARAFRAARRHSLVVRALKACLPAAALAAISLYFIPGKLSFSLRDGTASVDSIEVRPGSLKMVNPKLTGVHKSHGRYEIRAKSATQDVSAPQRVHLDQISGDLVSPTGAKTTLEAPSGIFHTKKEQLTLDQGVTIEGDDGLLVQLESATVTFPERLVVSKTPVVMRFRGSEIRAQSLRLQIGESRAVFIGGVKVHIERKTQVSKK